MHKSWYISTLFSMLVWSCNSQSTASVPLRNAAQPGVMMPMVGLGTGGYGDVNGNGGEYWGNETGEAAAKAWLSLGGVRIDASWGYVSQAGVGQGIKDSGVNRSQIFITSKVDPVGFNESLMQWKYIQEQLQTDYVDLLLVHWPGNSPCPTNNGSFKDCRVGSWKALEQIFQSGGARAIGVSNFEVQHLLDIFELNSLKPAVNQIEFHPYWHEDDLLDFCIKNNIQFNSYSPLGAPDHMAFEKESWGYPLLERDDIKQIAQWHNKTSAQVILRWHIQQGIVINPRTQDPNHMKDNLNIFDFELSFEEMSLLSFIQKPMYKVCGDPRLIL